MTSVLTKANDLCNSSDEDQSESDNSDSEISNNSLNTSLELDTGHLINTCGEMSDNSSKSSLASSSTKAANVDDMEESEGSSNAASRVKKLTKKCPKKTNIKFHSSRNSKPKSESEALVQVGKSIEHSSIQQEKNKDSRLQALLEADQKRDEMFLAYQREQAEANRKHELLMAQLLLQSRPPSMEMHGPNYRNSFSNDFPLSSAGNSWNTLDHTPGASHDVNYRYHQL